MKTVAPYQLGPSLPSPRHSNQVLLYVAYWHSYIKYAGAEDKVLGERKEQSEVAVTTSPSLKRSISGEVILVVVEQRLKVKEVGAEVQFLIAGGLYSVSALRENEQ